MEYVEITAEMEREAIRMAAMRKQIKHHFEVKHMSSAVRDKVGFLGEFAAAHYLGYDWRGLLDRAMTGPDGGDLLHNGLVLDVKTETVPLEYAQMIATRTIGDDVKYGRRLINKKQFFLLQKYDYVVFGLFIRGELNRWYPTGYLDAPTITREYRPRRQRPDGGWYPQAASPVRTSNLNPLNMLE